MVVSNTQKKEKTCSNFSTPPPFSVLFLLCRISVKLLHQLPERRSDCKDADLHYSIHEKQSTLSRLEFLFQKKFLTSPPCSGRHKTEAKYIAAIKLKWEVVFFLNKFDIKI